MFVVNLGLFPDEIDGRCADLRLSRLLSRYHLEDGARISGGFPVLGPGAALIAEYSCGVRGMG